MSVYMYIYIDMHFGCPDILELTAHHVFVMPDSDFGNISEVKAALESPSESQSSFLWKACIVCICIYTYTYVYMQLVLSITLTNIMLRCV